MSKPGRNDPCYCGSGKKYKQCHLPIDAAVERENRERAQAARFLRLELPRFARSERFSADFDQGLPFYWNDYYDANNAGEMSEFEALRYLDWLVFDHVLEDGSNIIDVYAEEFGDSLSDVQLSLLNSWRGAPAASAYELTSYDGQVLQLKDVFSGDTYQVFEAGGRGNVEVGEVILARMVPVFDQVQFSTVAAYFPDDESVELTAYIEAARAAQGGELDMAAFANKNSHLIIHYALRKAEEAGRPPVARLDKNRTDMPVQTGSHETEDRVIRQRSYGSTKPHMTQTRRKVV